LYTSTVTCSELRPLHIRTSWLDTTGRPCGLSATCWSQAWGYYRGYRLAMELSQTFWIPLECYEEVMGIWTMLTFRD